jgi:hypothetical protein
MEIQFAAAKVRKYAMHESGDTLEMTERPHGGISLVLADGQRSGRSAKRISNVVVRKAIQLLSEGVRDGAAARAAGDYLYTYRNGKVSATLNIISVDTRSRTVVITRNNPSPVLVHRTTTGLELLNEPSDSVGVHSLTRPVITEIPFTAGLTVVAATDGLFHAGTRSGSLLYQPQAVLAELLAQEEMGVQTIADTLLQGAVEMYGGWPLDDISVLVVAIRPGLEEDQVRRLSGRFAVRP